MLEKISNAVKIAPVVTALLVAGASIGSPSKRAQADDCVAAPNSPAPAGSRWLYHRDPATHRKCWALRPSNKAAHQPAAAAPAEPAVGDWRHQPNPVSDTELKQDEATCTTKAHEGSAGAGSPEFKFYLAFWACMQAAGYASASQ